MPRTNQRLLRQVADIAEVQDGLITAAQLAEIGFARSTLQRRTRQGGPWRRVLPGVYLIGLGPLTERQRHRAATLYVGEPCLLTGFAALGALGFVDGRSAGEVHLLVPQTKRRTRHGFVHVERTRHWPSGVEADGFLVAPAARAAIDACRRLDSPSRVRGLLTGVVNAGLATREALERELHQSQRRRSALAREALALMAAGPASVAELDLFQRWTVSDLPRAEWNVDLFTPAGVFIARPDVFLPDGGVIVEVDSMAYHYSRPEWDATMRRHARLTAFGLLVVHVTPARIREDWPGVVRDVRGAIESRDGQSAPDIRWRRRA